MLPVFTLTFLFGLILGSYLSYFPMSVVALLLGCIGLLTYLETQGALAPRRSQVLFASVVGGCLYWMIFAWFTPHAPLPDNRSALPPHFDGIISEPVRHSPGRLTALVEVTVMEDPSFVVPFHLRLTWRDPDRDLHRGLQIRARTHLHAPSGTLNPRGFDYAAYLDTQGVDAVGSVSGAGAVEVLDFEPGNGSTILAFDRRMAQPGPVGRRILSQPSRGLFLSLTIGEQGFLAPEVREWFMTTGTVHILSISGSHLGLIALLSFALIRERMSRPSFDDVAEPSDGSLLRGWRRL